MYEQKKLERYLRVNLLGPGLRLIKKEFTGPRGEFRPRQTRQLPRAVDLKGRLLSCQSY